MKLEKGFFGGAAFNFELYDFLSEVDLFYGNSIEIC
jgi:hypothetical protein